MGRYLSFGFMGTLLDGGRKRGNAKKEKDGALQFGDSLELAIAFMQLSKTEDQSA